MWGTYLVVQWLRLWAPDAGGPGLIPGQGTRSHMQQLRHSAAKSIKKLIKKNKIYVEPQKTQCQKVS